MKSTFRLPASSRRAALKRPSRPPWSGLLPVALLIFFTVASRGAERVPWTSNRVSGSPNPPAPYVAERVLPQLNFAQPVDIQALPGSDRLLVLEQGGKLVSFHNQSAAEKPSLVFDFKAHHQPFDSAYSVTFHPKFAENRQVFVCYVEPGGRKEGSIISRFTLSSVEPPVIDPASEQVIIRWFSGGHNGCTVAFGNDGMLYICNGDGANPDPPDDLVKTGQDISDLMAGILRIDVDHPAAGRAYSIPRDNPFINTPGARAEVYAFGMRNPWRMSFDRATGDLWAGDVGWEQWEMIYLVRPGGNYGWSITEGPNTHVRTDTKPGPGPILPPMVSLPHSEAASITGGLVYRGRKLPKLAGAYIYGDWETGKFWALRQDHGRLLANDELCDTTLKPVSFTTDQAGELLFLDYNGGIYTLTPNAAPVANAAFPRRLSETGLFKDPAALLPAPGVVSYRPAAPMWNDYAQAERLLGIPGADSIATANGRETITGRMWYFPSNTVVARTLSLELNAGLPASKRRIETQMMHFDGQTWNAYTYRWNAAQTDADLVPAEGTNEVFSVTDQAAPGGRREIAWRYLSRAECFRCHNVWATDLLSFNWLQLNSTGPEQEIRRLEKLGLVRVVDNPPFKGRLVDPADTSHPLADRARSWLHANCAGCHRFGAGGGVPSQFNFDQPIEQARIIDAVPTRGDFGISGARIIAPGEPFHSVLYHRINNEGSGHMPHIGTRLTDEAGARLLRDWIRSLPIAPNPDATKGLAERQAEEERTLQSLDAAETRPAAINRLLATTSGALALLDKASASSGSLREDAAQAAASHPNAQARDLFQRLLPSDQRRHTLGFNIDPKSILALKGSADRGKDLFLGAAQCSTCHVCDGAGRAFGPELTGLSRKYTHAQALEQILQPSKIIAPEFKSVTLTLKDDSDLTGFVLRRNASELVLRDGALVEHTVKLDQVRETRESTLSAMPEGLFAPLTSQEAADLLEYLCGKPASR